MHLEFRYQFLYSYRSFHPGLGLSGREKGENMKFFVVEVAAGSFALLFGSYRFTLPTKSWISPAFPKAFMMYGDRSDISDLTVSQHSAAFPNRN